MGFYDEAENVRQYIEMAKGYDGKELIDQLKNMLPQDSSVLEIGSGPGVDLHILGQYFKVTGSDLSPVFRDLYLDQHPRADWLLLDAVSLDTQRKWDALYSNKVLHHLSRSELQSSIKKQKAILRPGGIILHSFWKGTGSQDIQGLFFQYYEQDELENLFTPHFDIIEIQVYTEMDNDDSLSILARSQD